MENTNSNLVGLTDSEVQSKEYFVIIYLRFSIL